MAGSPKGSGTLHHWLHVSDQRSHGLREGWRRVTFLNNREGPWGRRRSPQPKPPPQWMNTINAGTNYSAALISGHWTLLNQMGHLTCTDFSTQASVSFFFFLKHFLSIFVPFILTGQLEKERKLSKYGLSAHIRPCHSSHIMCVLTWWSTRKRFWRERTPRAQGRGSEDRDRTVKPNSPHTAFTPSVDFDVLKSNELQRVRMTLGPLYSGT